MSKTEKPNKEQVFKQEVSDDELEAVAGGKILPPIKSPKETSKVKIVKEVNEAASVNIVK